MQAIATRYLPATNNRPSRMRAWCERGSITVSYHCSGNDMPRYAAEALCRKFA